MHYFITINGLSVGPMTKEQLVSYDVTKDTPVSKDGGPWAPLYTYPELMLAYQMSGKAVAESVEVSNKKLACGILAILAGTLGIHYFVMGKVAGGILTIIISFITCGMWGFLMMIQGILMLCMSDEDFERKYLDSMSTLPLF